MMNRSADGLGITMISAILVVTALLSAGQVLFKYAARDLNFTRPATFVSLPLIVALVLYAVATVSWLLVLTKVPLNIAFPFYGLVFLLVPLLSWAILKEPLSAPTIVGSVIIAVGVVVVALGSRT